MHPGDRGEGRRGGMGGGGLGRNFGDFPSFPDPFPGFGLFGGGGVGGGGGGGRSLVDEFFGHDPFDDPFFRRPFGGLFGPPGNSLLGSGSLFGSMRENMGMGMGMGMGLAMGMGMLDDERFRRPSNEVFIDQRPFNPTRVSLDDEPFDPPSNEVFIDHRHFNPPQPHVRQGPVIEELPDDNEVSASESKPANTEPIVEHPDEEAIPDTGDVEHEARNIRQQYQSSQIQPNYTSQSFSYHRSTISGPGGVYYTSSSKRRVGPNGVMEAEHHEKDSSAGIENSGVARAIGDKMHAVCKKRNADGRENTLETLHNLTEEEAVKFNETWETHAASSLPGSRSRSRMLEGNSSGSSSRPQLRLPSTEGVDDVIEQPNKLLRRR